MLKALLALILWIIFTTDVSALSSPTLLSPSNNDITSSTSLSWATVEQSIQYRIIIDDEPETKTPYIKNYYTTSTTYSPELNFGLYYWKVGAKDSLGDWVWSETRSFTLQQASTSPTVQPTPSLSPTPTNNPSSTPQPTLKSTFFQINNIPQIINSYQSFDIKIDLSLPNSPNAVFYLKGAFKKFDSTNYFGLTKVDSNWVKNGTSYSSQHKIMTDANGNWSGNIEFQLDASDSGYDGSGEYFFKVARYTTTGSGPIWSDEYKINIQAKPIEQSPEEDLISFDGIQEPEPTLSTIEKLPTPLPELPEQIYSLENYIATKSSSNATVAGQSISNSGYKQDNNNNLRFFLIGSGLLLILSIAGWYLRIYFNKIKYFHNQD